MRVLMFGWEFPPHISGGLGTASYGLTKGMATFGDLDVIFVVPKSWGDEDQSIVRLIGANQFHIRRFIIRDSRGQLRRLKLNRRSYRILILKISGK
jgi:hypothetical protein